MASRWKELGHGGWEGDHQWVLLQDHANHAKFRLEYRGPDGSWRHKPVFFPARPAGTAEG